MDNNLTQGDNKCIMYQLFSGFMLLISTIVFISVLAWTIKFVRVFGLTKKMQFMFLFCVGVSALARVVFFITDLIWRSGDCTETPGLGIEGSISWLDADMFLTAIVINIFNWIYQTVRIEKFRTGQRQKQILWHILFVTINVAIFIQYFTLLFTAGMTNKDYRKVFRVFGFIYGITFGLTAVAFTIVGINLYRKYSQVSKEKARQNRIRIFSSIAVIFFAFMTRGIFIIVSYAININDGIAHKMLDNAKISTLIILFFYYMIVDVLPTIYLGFGISVVTKKKLKKSDYPCLTRGSTAGFTEMNKTGKTNLVLNESISSEGLTMSLNSEN